MNYTEKPLNDAELSGIKAPEDMEARLRKALESAPVRKVKKSVFNTKWKFAAAIIALSLFVGNNYHALAYYSKTLLGFDKVLTSTLSQLNNQGRGQVLNEQVKLMDGTVLTINGLMSDENQLLLFYTLNNANGIPELDSNIFAPVQMKGFRTNSSPGIGGASPSKDGTEVKGYISFEPVSPLAKKLTLSYWEGIPGTDHRQLSEIVLPYHPDEALTTIFKQPMDQSITVDDNTLVFKSITATPTMTFIQGEVQVESTKQLDQAARVLDGLQLVSNDITCEKRKGGLTRIEDGRYEFIFQYGPLTDKLQSLQLILKEYQDFHESSMRIPLTDINKQLFIEDKPVKIAKVEQVDKETEVTIETESLVRLEGIKLVNKSDSMSWVTSGPATYHTAADGTTRMNVTFVFPNREGWDYLQIKGFSYPKHLGYKSDIPIK
ncbi:DUF4179 domain-containing protein [Paenibacillus sp. N1-5-1-14]|uniref:DUF4179 domain-containing protein n=1 Tax=Paenibacillus radicibacter TaxID=2972488 RepID=UPI002158C049|nr:DUF4179 domain-containing protein [Paenibacillus radicibacter]MCR8644221.1 DUF4179 domain-containing protein [Paenibacillus radicibacter]